MGPTPQRSDHHGIVTHATAPAPPQRGAALPTETDAHRLDAPVLLQGWSTFNTVIVMPDISEGTQ